MDKTATRNDSVTHLNILLIDIKELAKQRLNSSKDDEYAYIFNKVLLALKASEAALTQAYEQGWNEAVEVAAKKSYSHGAGGADAIRRLRIGGEEKVSGIEGE